MIEHADIVEALKQGNFTYVKHPVVYNVYIFNVGDGERPQSLFVQASNLGTGYFISNVEIDGKETECVDIRRELVRILEEDELKALKYLN